MIKARESLYFDEEDQAIGSVGADALHRPEAEVYQQVRRVDEGIDPYGFTGAEAPRLPCVKGGAPRSES